MTTKNKAGFWNEERLGYIHETLHSPASGVAEALGVTANSVYGVRAKLKRGFTGTKWSAWGAEDDLIITKYANTRSPSQIAAMFPGRTRSSVSSRMRKLGVQPALKGERFSPFSRDGRPLLAKTCTRCGELIAAKDYFAFKDTGNIKSHCRFCDAELKKLWRVENPERAAEHGFSSGGADRASEWRRRADEATRPSAKRSGEPYLERDFVVLENSSLSVLGKALKLERTWSAVHQACRRFGFGSKSANSLPMREDEKWSIDNPNADRVEQITAELKQEFKQAGVQFPEWDWDD